MPDASKMKFAIICSEWNEQVTDALLKGAFDTLEENFYTTCPYYFEIYNSDWSQYFERDFGVKGVLEAGDAVIMDGPFTEGAESKWE